MGCKKSVEAPLKELTPLEAELATQQVLPAVQACYEEVKAALPNDKGRVELVLKIDSEGSIVSFTEHSPNKLSVPMVECVNKKFGSVVIDVPEGSSGGTLSLDLRWE